MLKISRLPHLFFLVVALACSAASLAVDKKTDEAVSFVTQRVTVFGEVEHKLSLGVAELRRFPLQRIGETNLVCQSGAEAGKLENFVGVRLRDILEKATIISREHNDLKKTIIIATASDGYKAVFSWNELFNSPLGEGVIVFFEKNGAPLDDIEGRLAMVSMQDLRTGPRHVRWLQGIEVLRVAQ
ncbi:MAG: molybdopterin-dependent oxidoreductase [Betaproteobacteria bacterium]|nr:molybdopterin-dependent oxidoreductase [Betaproteobacteria bacterium]